MADKIKIEVITHSNREHIVEVETYDYDDLYDQTNDTNVQTIKIGDKIFSRIDIKYIGPVEEDAD